MIGLICLLVVTVLGHEGEEHSQDQSYRINQLDSQLDSQTPTAATVKPTPLPQEKPPDNGQSFAEVDLPEECRESNTWDTCPGKQLILL